ncbi:MAG: thiamine-phosphate pyrophosphorylase [Candidatus Zixiibacteriota bacterium]|nr:MAG: thiamine-phosphate pyrophosphorylase [candidate division Zixibacteria bacterium]
MDKKNIYRILDANLNRAREGIRVTEEVARLYFDDAKLSSKFKRLRHELTRVARESFDEEKLLTFRDSEKDVGADSMGSLEKKRADVSSIVQANLRRAQEATRVLEEFGKLINPDSAKTFKRIRFRLYALEQKMMGSVKR